MESEKIQNERLCQELYKSLTDYCDKQPKFRKYYEKTNKSIEECVKYLKEYAKKHYRDGDCAYMTPKVVFARTLRYFMDDDLKMPNDVKPAPASKPSTPATPATSATSKKGKGKNEKKQESKQEDLFADAKQDEQPKTIDININLTTDDSKPKQEEGKPVGEPKMEICGGTDIDFDEDDL